MLKTYRIKISMAVLACTILIGGCSTTPVVSKRKPDNISGITKMIVVPPIVECIDANNGNPTSLDENTGNEVRLALETGFRSELAKKQVEFFEMTDLIDVDARLEEDLDGFYRRIKLHSSPIDTHQQDRLSRLTEKTGASHLMFCRCRLHTGPGGYWNPMSGAIASGSSRIVLECHLYDVQNKRVAWTNASQTRASPSEAKSNISGMVPLILETMEVK